MSLLLPQEVAPGLVTPSSPEWWESTGPHPEEWERHPTIPDVFIERGVILPELADDTGVLLERATTTVTVFRRELGSVVISAVNCPTAERPTEYCLRAGDDVVAAMSAGFYHMEKHLPMGEFVIDGEPQLHVPFGSPWDEQRGTVYFEGNDIEGSRIIIDGRNSEKIPAEPTGSLVVAGPLLVRDGKPVVDDSDDNAEGFRDTSPMHDCGVPVVGRKQRVPRGAIGHCGRYVYAVMVDGRGDDAGMTVTELARYGAERGIPYLLGLDGGGTAVAAVRDVDGVHRIINRPMNVRNRTRKDPLDPPEVQGYPDGTPYPPPGGCRPVYSLFVFRNVRAA